MRKEYNLVTGGNIPGVADVMYLLPVDNKDKTYGFDAPVLTGQITDCITENNMTVLNKNSYYWLSAWYNRENVKEIWQHIANFNKVQGPTPGVDEVKHFLDNLDSLYRIEKKAGD
jgi:hypothetical protein